MDWLDKIILEMKKYKKLYIRGTDIESKKLLFILLQCKIRVTGFVDNIHSILYGLPVEQEESLQQDRTYILSPTDIFLSENLQKISDTMRFTWEEEGEEFGCNAPLAITMLLSRSSHCDTVLIVNRDSKSFWENIVKTFQLKVIRIYAIEDGLDALYDLCYFNIESLIVGVCVRKKEDVINSLLENIGLRKTVNIIYAYNSFSGHITEGYKGFDWFLGNTYNGDKEFPGFTVLQSQEKVDMPLERIVILGNSTADPLFYPQKSWPEYLAEELDNLHKNYIIYNGAITDYSSTNELYKLIRDVLQMSPNIVISYGGFIDFREYMEGFPYINLNLMRTTRLLESLDKSIVYGVTDRRSAYERWLDNERIMHLLCEMRGIRFYGILQPWIGSNQNTENKLLEAWYKNYWSVRFPQFSNLLSNADEFKRNIKKDSLEEKWLRDYTSIFNNIPIEELFYDANHVNEKGNEMISKHILQDIFIMPEI